MLLEIRRNRFLVEELDHKPVEPSDKTGHGLNDSGESLIAAGLHIWPLKPLPLLPLRQKRDKPLSEICPLSGIRPLLSF